MPEEDSSSREDKTLTEGLRSDSEDGLSTGYRTKEDLETSKQKIPPEVMKALDEHLRGTIDNIRAPDKSDTFFR